MLNRSLNIAAILAFALVLVNELGWFPYRHFVVGIPIVDNLSLHLCDLSVFVLFAGAGNRWEAVVRTGSF